MLLVRTPNKGRKYWALFHTKDLKRDDCNMLSKRFRYVLLSGKWYAYDKARREIRSTYRRNGSANFRKASSYGKGIESNRVKIVGRVRPNWANYWLGKT